MLINIKQTLIHTAFTASFVHFDGPHSCRVDSSTKIPKGLTREIRDSQGEVLQSGGTFKSTRLPTEPLAIARACASAVSVTPAHLHALEQISSSGTSRTVARRWLWCRTPTRCT